MLQATPQSPMVSQPSTPRVPPYAKAGPCLGGGDSGSSSGRASRDSSGSGRMGGRGVYALGAGLGMRRSGSAPKVSIEGSPETEELRRQVTERLTV